MEKYNLKQCAHIGDAIWEVFARKIVIANAKTYTAMHKMTVELVNAQFQAKIIEIIAPDLTESEKQLVKRGLNLPLTVKKKNNQNIHRHATAFEVLIGYFYLNDKKRLEMLFDLIQKKAL